ncbi:glycosyltransferase [Rhodobacter sp. TJ_12]|uniref:glycosyltransferase n=1 Tax=Rhodobacter sp. TJ_12 TaxID=2029399 RepID=UPI001CBE580B|nr:glycosyltransferase [Rhodobacter sp. TJ_12]
MTEKAPSGDPQDSLWDDFDPVWYLERHEDVRISGMDPWDHYRNTGRAEGRLGAPVQAFELEHMLWNGQDSAALTALKALLAGPSQRERAAAGWALARWYGAQSDWPAAHAAILLFLETPDAARVVAHMGPWLLGVQACLACNDQTGAERFLAEALDHFGPRPDLSLAQMLLIRADGAEDAALSVSLSALHPPHGLAPVTLAPGDGARFDRLQASAAPAETTQEDLPLVSVIVPVFNAATGGHGGLSTALRGLVAQSWQNLEILVVDDGSTDDSLAVAQAWAARDRRIRVLPQARNCGAYPARNAGLTAATGAFITVHDADDWSHPEKIAAQARILLEDPDCMATVSHWVRASDDLDMTLWRMDQGWVYRNVSSLMLRAELRERLGYWDRVRVNADTEYYYRIIAAFGPSAIREVFPGVPLSFGRTAAGSLTMQSETHLRSQFSGVRRDYMEAAHYWHSISLKDGDKALFLPEFPEVRPFRVPALIGCGDPEGPPSDYDLLSTSELFDPDWYLKAHPDVYRSGIGPVRHHLLGGGREDRDPGPLFSSGGYRLAQNLDDETVPLIQYEREGRAQGAPPLPRFEGALQDRTPDCLFFAHSLGKTLFGAERSLIDVLTRMAGRGAAPVVVVPTLRNRDYLTQLRKVSVAVECLPQIWRHAGRDPDPRTVTAIRALIRRYQPKTVHVNTLVQDAPLVAAAAEGIETVVHVRELPEDDVALRRTLNCSAAELRRQLLDQADRFVANSNIVAHWLDCPERVVVRPNSVPETLFALPFAPQDVLRIGLISSNVAKKGVTDFLRIARIVAAQKRPIRFLLIGPPSRDLHLLQPLPDNVDFRDYAETPEEAIAQVDVVMSLSKFAESFGRTVMEAMAGGRPVICYDRGAPPDMVRSGETGFVVPPDDPSAAANAVLALDAARGQLLRLSDAARKRARALQDQAFLP